MINAAVVGSPIAHSLSPILHRSAYDYLKLAGEYTQFEVASGELAQFLATHDQLNALSLTMPLKEEAISVAHSVSDLAKQIASGNTLSKTDGQWRLTSTDVAGFGHACAANRVSLAGTVLIIGAGATARAIVAACAGSSQEIHLISRNSVRENAIRAAAAGAKVIFHPWDKHLLLNTADLVVNTTPGTTADFFTGYVSKPVGAFFEVLYHPWPTQLLSCWRQQGGSTVDGMDFLVHQAISQIEIFAGQQIDRLELAAVMRSAGLVALA